MSEEVATVVKRGPGRPPKAKPDISEKLPEAPKKWVGKAKPNWETLDPNRAETPSRLQIPVEEWPAGYVLQWVTDSILGQPMAQHRSRFESEGGWTPVHQEDFDGRFNGRFMKRDQEGEILLEGLVLMYRPIELNEKAKRLEKRRAREQLEIKERALRGGDIPGVTLDARAPNAVESNRITKSYERIQVPED